MKASKFTDAQKIDADINSDATQTGLNRVADG
ncbi:hypothetical protein TG4357_00499 [Thalassovita gelatinovora]|uniref:Uncharacterized protein n=1 Tax=Thalassovita gelatinovora TaxID=53501 RepID=A0A0P1F5S5_THAGE|nr:hypothetical protein TG4357_00499 [Thalassovita gelatinovora]